MTTRKGRARDGFSFSTRYRQGHNSIAMRTPFFDAPIETKADLLPRWLLQPAEPKAPIRRPIRDTYPRDMDLPVPVMTAAEIAASKLARWQREPRVRDLYDLHHLLADIDDAAPVAAMWSSSATRRQPTRSSLPPSRGGRHWF